jgi:hypothetical protein
VPPDEVSMPLTPRRWESTRVQDPSVSMEAIDCRRGFDSLGVDVEATVEADGIGGIGRSVLLFSLTALLLPFYQIP